MRHPEITQMNRISAFAVLALLASPVFADDKDKPAKGDLAKFQGTWTSSFGANNEVGLVVTFKESAAHVKFTIGDGQSIEVDGAIKLDEKAKPHKTVDWVDFKAPQGDAAPDNFGIYEFIDDNTLKVCNGGPGNERPTEFKAGDSGAPQLITLKREAKKAADETKTEAIKGDLAALQGEWAAQAGPEKNVPVLLKIKGNTVSLAFEVNGDSREMKGEVKIDDAAKPHKTIDWVKFTRPDGEDAPANLGIYTLEGDKFTVCSGGPGKERPTEMKAADMGQPSLLVFTKKPAAK
jgi:uncharacterized protein (TIGR03067 family)